MIYTISILSGLLILSGLIAKHFFKKYIETKNELKMSDKIIELQKKAAKENELLSKEYAKIDEQIQGEKNAKKKLSFHDKIKLANRNLDSIR